MILKYSKVHLMLVILFSLGGAVNSWGEALSLPRIVDGDGNAPLSPSHSTSQSSGGLDLYSVVGIVQSGDLRRAFIKAKDHATLVYVEKDILPAGWLLQKIENDRVIFSRGDVTQTLKIGFTDDTENIASPGIEGALESPEGVIAENGFGGEAARVSGATFPIDDHALMGLSRIQSGKLVEYLVETNRPRHITGAPSELIEGALNIVNGRLDESFSTPIQLP